MSSDWSIALSDLDYGPEESAAVARVLESKWLSMGPEVQAFEKEFASFIGVKHACAVASGTAALHLAYLAVGAGPGTQVVQPAINFVAAANMTAALGATPVFADILAVDEPTIDPEGLARLLAPQTRAVVVMHYGGYLCRMGEISALCKRAGIAIIEDACHAIGASYRDPAERPPHGKKAGALGDIACFSFFSNKNLATGEGGMITTDRDDLAQRVRSLRSHGMTTLTWDRYKGHAASYDVVAHGFNYRLDEIHAALGRVQLGKLDRNNQRRNVLTALYRRALDSVPNCLVPFAGYTGDAACHLMVVLAPDCASRDRAVALLKERKIQTSLHYPCIPDFTAFAAFAGAQVERARCFARRAITLPMHPLLKPEQILEICGILREVLGGGPPQRGEIPNPAGA